MYYLPRFLLLLIYQQMPFSAFAQPGDGDHVPVGFGPAPDRADPMLWRAECMYKAGYSLEQAGKLAVGNCDLHEAVELLPIVLQAGGTRETAFDILSD